MTREEMLEKVRALNGGQDSGVYRLEERADGSATIVAEAAGKAKGSSLQALRAMHAAVTE